MKRWSHADLRGAWKAGQYLHVKLLKLLILMAFLDGLDRVPYVDF
jgi:hypothetical protein